MSFKDYTVFIYAIIYIANYIIIITTIIIGSLRNLSKYSLRYELFLIL